MMGGFLGVDTSNYTTSAAVYCQGRVIQRRELLPVRSGELGLRQSDAVFFHVKALGGLCQQLFHEFGGNISAVGVSSAPRNAEASYMPCFLAGVMAAQVTAAAMHLPLFTFSHQAGHLAAALFSTDRLDLLEKPFVAFHLSGGTTECVHSQNLLEGRLTPLSATNDLNAGQAVDRVGLMLGLSFPAGKALDALACQSTKTFSPKAVIRKGNPCLSGIENQCESMLKAGEKPCDIARFCLDSIAAAVVSMAQTAKIQTGIDTLVFAGGVMSNSIIRPIVAKKVGGVFASPELATDNAAGIAVLTAECAKGGIPNGNDGAKGITT